MLNYPVMLDLTKKRVVVIGSGREASKVLASLVGTGAYIRIVSSHIPQEYLLLNSIQKVNREYETGDVDKAFLIFLCTEDRGVKEHVYEDLVKGQLVFDYSQTEHSDFYPLRLEDTDSVTEEELKEIVTSSIEDVSDEESEIAMRKMIEQRGIKKEGESTF